MPDTISILSSSALFAGLPHSVLTAWAAGEQIHHRVYERGAILAFEGDPCETLGVVASGAVHICRLFPAGKQITLETLGPGDSFGEALLFSDSAAFPATLIARESSLVLHISRDGVIALCEKSPVFLSTLLRLLSNRILMMNARIKRLSFGSVRQKVANYLLEARAKQKSDVLHLSAARHELAGELGIPRPSLSRELIAMQEAGLLSFDRRVVRLLDVPALERLID